MKQLHFIIPCPNGVCLSTKRMKTLKEHLPTREILIEHMKLERYLVETVKGYQPKPFAISLEKEEMIAILSEIKSKARYDLPHIYLLLQIKNLPIAVIAEKVKED
jgi:hypothetical protein